MPQTVFLVTRSRGQGWNDSRSLEEQAEWDAHAAFMDALEAEGFVLLAGPVTGTRDALLVIRAANESEIHQRLSADPWTRNGLLHTTAVRMWTLRIGVLPNRLSNDAMVP